jgi:hypothetical protein
MIAVYSRRASGITDGAGGKIHRAENIKLLIYKEEHPPTTPAASLCDPSSGRRGANI